jgi:hypothetical protein
MLNDNIEREMIKVTLDNKLSITVTPRHHLIEIMENGQFCEKQSEVFEIGQKMLTKNGVLSKIICKEVIKTQKAVGNVILKGYPITNGIITSIRVKNDYPEMFFQIGM